MKNIESSISNLWLKAAVMGSIWAANEIILGSFLHNLKIPFSGSIMAFLSVVIMVSFCELWKDKNILWRAGLITALMKSISPSALILGPMVGIMMEALMLWFGLTIFRRNILGYIVGGALATSVVLFQKAGRLLLIFGFDLIEILRNLFTYISKQLSLTSSSASKLILIIILIYFAAGIVAAITGFVIGKKANKLKRENKQLSSSELNQGYLFSKTEKREYSILLLFLHVCAMLLGMYLINKSLIWGALIFQTAYFVFAFVKYHNALQKLKKPLFWIWFVVVTFCASYFLGDWQAAHGFNFTGLTAGLFMNLRAALIVIGFAALSTEIKNPVIKTIMYKRGAAPLYQSIELAFGILPLIITLLPPARQIIRHPFQSITALLNAANDLLNLVAQKSTNKPNVIIITGEVQQGKTSFLKAIIKRLNSQHIYPAGFLSEVIIENGERSGYKIVSIAGNESYMLCTTKPDINLVNYGRFYFYSNAFSFGRKLIDDALLTSPPLLIIDEIGPLEIQGGGWADSIHKICTQSNIPMIWVVRKSLADMAARKWSIGDATFIDIAEDRALDKIVEIVNDEL